MLSYAVLADPLISKQLAKRCAGLKLLSTKMVQRKRYKRAASVPATLATLSGPLSVKEASELGASRFCATSLKGAYCSLPRPSGMRAFG
jgi:hypothetical protein|eukprot:COSAG01_NODE_7022_length_3388_cov_44.646688_4_plen_89_part_00